jgi:hypothetical protein
MKKKELIEGLSKYSANTEIYVYDSDGCMLQLNCIEEGITSHGSKYKGEEQKIIKLKNRD